MAFLIWITGLSGSGKTTIAKKIYRKIKSDYINTVLLDGDDFRKITKQTTKHTIEERFRIAMQIARMCKILVDQEINVVCSTISLFKQVHKFNRNNFKDYFEVFLDCKKEELIRRDKRKIYSRVLKQEIKNVVGMDILYEKPKNSHLIIDNTFKRNLNENVQIILDSFNKRGFR